MGKSHTGQLRLRLLLTRNIWKWRPVLLNSYCYLRFAVFGGDFAYYGFLEKALSQTARRRSSLSGVRLKPRPFRKGLQTSVQLEHTGPETHPATAGT